MEAGLASGRDIFQLFTRERMEGVANGAVWVNGTVPTLRFSLASFFV
jgi:hypothetical protein